MYPLRWKCHWGEFVDNTCMRFEGHWSEWVDIGESVIELSGLTVYIKVRITEMGGFIILIFRGEGHCSEWVSYVFLLRCGPLRWVGWQYTCWDETHQVSKLILHISTQVRASQVNWLNTLLLVKDHTDTYVRWWHTCRMTATNVFWWHTCWGEGHWGEWTDDASAEVRTPEVLRCGTIEIDGTITYLLRWGPTEINGLIMCIHGPQYADSRTMA